MVVVPVISTAVKETELPTAIGFAEGVIRSVVPLDTVRLVLAEESNTVETRQ